MDNGQALAAARLAHEEALAHLLVVQAKWTDVRAALAPLKGIREANHFAERLYAAFGRGKQ